MLNNVETKIIVTFFKPCMKGSGSIWAEEEGGDLGVLEQTPTVAINAVNIAGMLKITIWNKHDFFRLKIEKLM